MTLRRIYVYIFLLFCACTQYIYLRMVKIVYQAKYRKISEMFTHSRVCEWYLYERILLYTYEWIFFCPRSTHQQNDDINVLGHRIITLYICIYTTLNIYNIYICVCMRTCVYEYKSVYDDDDNEIIIIYVEKRSRAATTMMARRSRRKTKVKYEKKNWINIFTF